MSSAGIATTGSGARLNTCRSVSADESHPRILLIGALALLLIDVFFLRWVWAHFDHWGFWDWDYQQSLLEAARISILEYGQLPLWNLWLGGGVSLAGNSLGHAWAPSFLWVLAFGTIAGLKLCIAFYVLVAQIGMWRLARIRGVDPAGPSSRRPSSRSEASMPIA